MEMKQIIINFSREADCVHEQLTNELNLLQETRKKIVRQTIKQSRRLDGKRPLKFYSGSYESSTFGKFLAADFEELEKKIDWLEKKEERKNDLGIRDMNLNHLHSYAGNEQTLVGFVGQNTQTGSN